VANPTTNYGFVLPTPTDLVTDLPADFDVALQGVDTQLKALQPGTTLGDLAYSSATANTNTRLGIGTDGQVLSVSSGVPAWATASASAMVLVKARTTFTTATDTSTTFDGVFTSTYKNYVVIIDQINGSVGGGGSTLNWVSRYGAVSQTSYYGNTNQVNLSGTVTNINGNGAAAIGLGQIYNGDQSLFDITVSGNNDSGRTMPISFHGFSSALNGSLNGGWQAANTRTYDGFQLSASSGTITGTVAIYGMVAS
jgi:hypothetical protein